MIAVSRRSARCDHAWRQQRLQVIRRQDRHRLLGHARRTHVGHRIDVDFTLGASHFANCRSDRQRNARCLASSGRPVILGQLKNVWVAGLLTSRAVAAT
jgi:hypothetical protein